MTEDIFSLPPHDLPDDFQGKHSPARPRRVLAEQSGRDRLLSTPVRRPPEPELPDDSESESIRPPSPSTPIRGRPVYPSGLSKGRVPLHRRGTSKTLETLEDLLRENGYKETRIFTPEAERNEAKAEQRRRQSTWRIRELLSGWLPGATGDNLANEDENTPVPARSRMSPAPAVERPNSPLSHKRRLQDHSASSTTLSSLGSVAPGDRTVSYHEPRPRHHFYDRILAVRPEQSSTSLRTYAQVSAARGYLRHMASTPAMAKGRMNKPYDTTPVDPLPDSWLDSVIKAVGKSGETAHIGGPLFRPPSRQSDRPSRPSRASKFSFADRTNAISVSGRRVPSLPPGATRYLRPQTAPGAINTAHVVCRSAPGSRSSSRIGDRRGGGAGSLRATSRKQRDRRGSRLGVDDRVPSLAATSVENDPLSSMHWVNGVRVLPVRMDVEVRMDAPGDGFDDAIDSDSDDEELDLARLLVPPKRQYSIQSLRKHLHVPQTQAQTQIQTHTHLSPLHGWEQDEDVDTQGQGRHVDIDEIDGYPTFDRGDSKRRRRLPGGWSHGVRA